MRATSAIALLLSLVSVARADYHVVGVPWLEWSCTGESCPTPVEFAAKVSEHLGASAALVAEHSQAKIWACVERLPAQAGQPTAWLAEARLLDKAGSVVSTRTISKDGESSATMADALALVTALLLSNPPEKPQRAPSTPGTPSAAPAPRATADTPPPSPPEPRRWGAKLDAGVSAALGLLPGLSGAGEIRAFADPPSGRTLFARLAFWPESTATVSPGQGSTLRLTTAGAGLCPVRGHTGSRGFALCAGADVGWLRASGFGFANSTRRDLWFADVTAEGEVEQSIADGFFASFGLRAIVPLIRTKVAYFTLGSATQVYRPWPVAAAAHLGLGYIFR